MFYVQHTKSSLQGVAVCSSFQHLENSNSSVWKQIFKAQSKLDSHSTDLLQNRQQPNADRTLLQKTDNEENKAGAFSRVPCLVLAGSSCCGMGNVANVANACGLVDRLQHDMRTLDCALPLLRPTAREQPVRAVQVCMVMCCVDM